MQLISVISTITFRTVGILYFKIVAPHSGQVYFLSTGQVTASRVLHCVSGVHVDSRVICATKLVNTSALLSAAAAAACSCDMSFNQLLTNTTNNIT